MNWMYFLEYVSISIAYPTGPKRIDEKLSIYKKRQKVASCWCGKKKNVDKCIKQFTSYLLIELLCLLNISSVSFVSIIC